MGNGKEGWLLMSAGSSLGVPRRKFGRQAEEVSCLAVGGGHLSRSYIGEQLAVRIIQAAIDEGITFLDNAWDYGNGESERRVGSALGCRRWARARPVATLVVGIESLAQLQQELAIARSFVPMSEPEKAELLARTRAAAADGRHEWFKTTNYFDAKVHLDQHGFPGFAEVRR